MLTGTVLIALRSLLRRTHPRRPEIAPKQAVSLLRGPIQLHPWVRGLGLASRLAVAELNTTSRRPEPIRSGPVFCRSELPHRPRHDKFSSTRLGIRPADALGADEKALAQGQGPRRDAW